MHVSHSWSTSVRAADSLVLLQNAPLPCLVTAPLSPPLLWSQMSVRQPFALGWNVINKDTSGVLWFKDYLENLSRFNVIIYFCLFVFRRIFKGKSSSLQVLIHWLLIIPFPFNLVPPILHQSDRFKHFQCKNLAEMQLKLFIQKQETFPRLSFFLY